MSGRPSSSKSRRQDRDAVYSDTRDLRYKHDVKIDRDLYSPDKPRSGAGDRYVQYHGERGRSNRSRYRDERDRGPPNTSDRAYVRSHRTEGAGDEGKDEVDGKRSDTKSLADDSRLSRLIKKVGREDDRDRRLSAVKQLKEYLAQPENAKTITKSSDYLLMSLLDIFYERTYKDVKHEVTACVGLVGLAMGQESHRFVEWLFANISPAPQDDVKSLLLCGMLETLKLYEDSQKINDSLPLVMSNCQSVLERADQSDLLMAVVDVIQHIASHHPHVFAPNFRDTVDILVGWHIDSTQKEGLTTYTAEALVSFHQFWVGDLNFSVTLLGQFLEDMEAYAEDLSIGLLGEVLDEDMPTPDECIIKISALLKVFTTVMRSLGDYFKPDKSPSVTAEFMSDIAERTVKCIHSVLEVMYCEKVYTSANKCLMLLCINMGEEINRVSDIMMEYIIEESKNERPSTNNHLLSFLQLTSKFVELLGTQMPVPFLMQILGPQALLHKLRMTHDNQVMTALLELYHMILGVKSVQTMEEAYRYILGDVQVAFNTLLEAIESDDRCNFVVNNPFANQIYTTQQAESAIIFDICVLAEIGNTKNNIIGMWALSPSLFDLFAKNLLPMQFSLKERYPAVQYALLEALYSHCSRHGHYVSSSHLITQNTILEGTVLANVSHTTGGHFTTAMSILMELLNDENAPYDSRVIALKWTQEIIDTLQSTQHIYRTVEFHRFIDALITSGYTSHTDLSLGTCECLQSLLIHTNHIDTTELARCQDLCFVQITSANESIKQSYQKLLAILPLEVTTSLTNGAPQTNFKTKMSGKLVTSSETNWLARRAQMVKIPPGTFHSNHFRMVLAFLLHGTSPDEEGCDWLERMYYSCLRSDKESANETLSSLSEVIDRSESLLWFWACWEAAQFCILSKLRTPLGKPQDTFTAIEIALKECAAEAKQAANEGESPATAGSTWDTKAIAGIAKRVHNLLQFMEHLQKQLYNAYEGTAVAIVNPPKAVQTFFRTNRATCQEWLGRIRSCLVTMAKHCGEPSLLVRLTFEQLREMKENNAIHSPEFDRALVLCVEGLVSLRCPEAIQGIYNWCKDILGKKLSWVKAAADLACGKYETAIADMQSSFRQYLNCESVSEENLSGSGSLDGTPTGSPRDIAEGMQKLSLLSRLSESNGKSASGKTETSDPFIAKFMVNQISLNYEKLCRWEDVLEWQENLQQYRKEYSSTSLDSTLSLGTDMNFIQTLSRFDALDYEGARDCLELVPGGSLLDLDKMDGFGPSLAWDPNGVVKAAEKQLVRAVTACLLDATQREVATRNLSLCRDSLEVIQQIAAFQWPAPLLHAVMLQQYNVNQCLKQLSTGTKPKSWLYPVCHHVQLDPQQHDLASALQALWCIDVQLQLQDVFQPEEQADFWTLASKVRIATINLARKTQNFHLAERLLVEEIFSSVGTTSECEKHSESDENIIDALTKLRESRASLSDQLHVIKMEREGSKLLACRGPSQAIQETLSSSILHHAHNLSKLNPTKNLHLLRLYCSLNARSMLTLAQCLQSDPKYLSQLTTKMRLMGDEENESSGCIDDFKALMELESKGNVIGVKSKTTEMEEDEQIKIADNPILSDSDTLIGRLLHLSTLQDPSLAKAWFSLASCCYKWGRKAVDHATHGSVDLSTEEKVNILDILPKGISNEETETALTILSQVHTDSSTEEDISDQDQSLYGDGAETTRRQLLASCMSLQIASDDCIEKLIEIWRGVVRRVYHYYQLSARAYFTYLQLNGQNNQETNRDGNITATLRLLRLLVKHAWELRNVLEDGLAHTPTAPWKGIIPQLFSRLNHPEPYVRQSVSDLLCRVAQDAPHLIVYPAVVGCSTQSKVKDTVRDGLLNRYLSQHEEEIDGETEDPQSQTAVDEETATEDRTNDMLQNCFSIIVDTLACSNPSMIAEVQLLVSELRRITLLWDELWLGTLNQQHSDVSRRLQQLDNEVKKVRNNTSLGQDEKTVIIQEKHKTVIKPTLYMMERLWEITNQPPETTHEQWFQDTYGQMIKDGIAKLRDPPDPSRPALTWQNFKQLHHLLQQRAQKRQSLVLNMDEISAKLATMKNTVIAMPGLSSAGQVVTIEAIHNNVQILPTKTKPKKLVFVGSDGKKYPYLFKGLEDLHLDERIMQFLAIVNNMFAKANSSKKDLYHARHYSVTPLGARSGLIQWVDGGTPLFSLYKRWQQREAIAQQLKQAGGQPNAVQPSISRPSEVFYTKLTPLLKDKGLLNMDNRKDWPLNTLKKVLEELIAETPGDLLAKELWCSTTSPREWWQITQTYNRSIAVMSMIGYIIGLGDRHLDNVLIDLATGEVVHIDYNVCFEKGKSLRVPEKVPFRLTRNLETALGITGVEGTFRLCCEFVIRTMRKGRETLLTLLEAFVYDPLVDWTTGNEGGYTGAFYGGGHTGNSSLALQQSKQDMEKEITLSMFSIRMAEMKESWNNNREEMLAALPKMCSIVHSYLQTQHEIQDAQKKTEKLHHQEEYLEEALHDQGHAIFSLHMRYAEYGVVEATKTAALKAVQDMLNDCEQWHTAHLHSQEALTGDKLQKLCSELSKPFTVTLTCFDSVTEFLNSAGQAQLVTQCESISNELSTAVHQRRTVIRAVLDILHVYATIVAHYPLRLVKESRTTRWQDWLQDLVCNFSTDKCLEIAGDVKEKHGTVLKSTMQLKALLESNSKLQKIYSDINDRLLVLAQRHNQEGADTGILTSHVLNTANAIHAFMQENGRKGTVCMTSVVATALSSLSKRYLIMESAAAGAGERLMDLTSREGDWFLDELCSMSGNVNQLLGLLHDPAVTRVVSAETCHQAMMAIDSINMVYTALQELNVNFRTIILPEALKILQSENPSLLEIINKLQELVNDSGDTLDGLVEKLEVLLINAMMGIEHTTDPVVVTAVKQMHRDFDLLQSCNPGDLDELKETCELSPGQMLIMGFNGLFTKLGADFDIMLDFIGKVPAPDTWKKVDVVKEAKSIQLTAFNESTLGLLSHIFFVKQFKAMMEFFTLASDVANAMNNCTTGNLADEETLSKPIKLFIAEYVRKHMIGLPSQTLGYILCHYINALGIDVTAEIELRDIGAECKVSLEELCKKSVDFNLKNGVFEHIHLSEASTLIGANDMAWRKSDLARRLENNMNVLKSSLQRSQLQLARFQWLYEDQLSEAGFTVNQLTTPSRSTVMSDLRKSIQSLVQQEAAVVNIQERHLQLESSVTQRLKWAAGANPSLSQVLLQLEDVLATKNMSVHNEGLQVGEVIAIGNAVLHFEALRTDTTEARSVDETFSKLIETCLGACQLIESTEIDITDTEEAVIQGKPLASGEAIDQSWINVRLEELGQETTVVSSELQQLGKTTESAKESIQLMVNDIRNILTTHHKLMSDIRTILKSMAKQEELDFGTEIVSGGVREYVNSYKNFSENFTTMMKLVMADDLTDDICSQIDQMIDTLSHQIVNIYDMLKNFAPPLPSLKPSEEVQPPSFAAALKKTDPLSVVVSPKHVVSGVGKQDLLAGLSSGAASPQTSTSTTSTKITSATGKKADKITRDPRTGKAIQERNSYAVGVWRRVKTKLDGRDPDLNKRLSVAEQVDYVIKEATTPDNLAAMYEGWTPWV